MKYIDCEYFAEVRPITSERVGGCAGGILCLTIDEAQAQVDLYIGRYLPLLEIPPSLKGIMVDLVEYRLSEDEATELAKERYDEAIMMLGRIEKGGFPEFIDEDVHGGNYASFGKNHNATIDRSAW